MESFSKDEWLPKPSCCDNCQSPKVVNVGNHVIYGTNRGDWPLIWFCRACRAAVSCHPQTKIPMGTMATAPTRAARQRAHKAFDRLFNKTVMSRSQAYRWLSYMMGIERSMCHISHFNEEQCLMVAKISRQYMSELKKKPAAQVYRKGRKMSRRTNKKGNDNAISHKNNSSY